MLSNKPYLIRAFYEWIVDSKCTPYLVLDATFPLCQVPDEFVTDGQITLNVSPEAIRELKVGNDFLEFRASFGNAVHLISSPIKGVLAIYAQENGQGMFFDFEEENEGAVGADNPLLDKSAQKVAQPESDKKSRPSHLKLVE